MNLSELSVDKELLSGTNAEDNTKENIDNKIFYLFSGFIYSIFK
jgi:hypothetical protein